MRGAFAWEPLPTYPARGGPQQVPLCDELICEIERYTSLNIFCIVAGFLQRSKLLKKQVLRNTSADVWLNNPCIVTSVSLWRACAACCKLYSTSESRAGQTHSMQPSHLCIFVWPTPSACGNPKMYVKWKKVVAFPLLLPVLMCSAPTSPRHKFLNSHFAIARMRMLYRVPDVSSPAEVQRQNDLPCSTVAHQQISQKFWHRKRHREVADPRRQGNDSSTRNGSTFQTD